MNERPLEIWVLTDGRAGNEAQALGLAHAVSRINTANITVKRIALKSWTAWIPPALSSRLGVSEKGWPFSSLSEGREHLRWPWPDLLISTGRRAAPIAAALRQLHGLSAVHILDPQMAPSAFDAVIVPEHDPLTGGNVLKSVGALSHLTSEVIGEAAKHWEDRLSEIPQPRMAVLIGGPSKSARFDESDERNLTLALQGLVAKHGLLITSSRRTRPAFAAKVAEVCARRAFVWNGKGENPYPAILGLAEAVLVTEDSVNMASEAATTGLPVHVFPVSSVAPKFARFHESLEARGASRKFTGHIETWTYEPLAEADRIAADLARRGVV